MKRAQPSDPPPAGAPPAPESPVSLRAMYAEAMREVMTDPRKALSEHDPWLAALLMPSVPGSPAKG